MEKTKETTNEGNDSDCEIITSDVTVITINDSLNDMVQLEQEQSIIELEDGEIPDEIVLNNEKLFEIHFCNKDAYEKYGTLLDKVIQEKLSQESNEQIKCCIETTDDKSGSGMKKLIYRKYHQQQQQEHQEKNYSVKKTCSQNEEIQRKIDERRQRDLMREQSPDLSGISNLFVLDVEPNDKLDFLSIPSYKRSFKDALGGDTEEKRVKDEKAQCFRKSSKHACFNCGDTSHSLRECVLPRAQHRIRNAMKAFKQSDRYHMSVDQRFSSIEPGCISDALRAAMALQKGELPFFFYRMRVLGYPPGWLEDAKIQRSEMTIYDADGSRVLASDEEEGEMYALTYKYNATKIIDFPGFNQYPGDNFYDDYKYYKVPRFSKRQSKEEFIKGLGDAVFHGYKRRKLKDLPSFNTTNASNVNNNTNVVEDMEIEDADDSFTEQKVFVQAPLPPEKPANDDTPKATCSKLYENSDVKAAENELKCSIIDSVNLSAVETKQQQLLKELQINNSVENPSTSASNEDSVNDEVLKIVQTNSVIISSSTMDHEQEIQEKQKKSPNIETVESKDDLEKIYLGTPILKFTPYERLPSREKFREGMSDVINFENLPTSTGKYKEMEKILKKVKETMQKIHQEDAI